MVRNRSAEWKLDPAKVGVMGFSAGGHLASTAGTHFEKSLIENKSNTNLRPDFMVLIYPVISMDSTGHKGSSENLLGANPTPERMDAYSSQKQVRANTPPTFLVHTNDDKTVPVSNSLDFFEALKKNNIPSSINLYDYGGHGFGMNNPTTSDQWFERMLNWFKGRGLL
jgi:dipeptidyl aminopeptidase/acylaminoacyl peptidase